MHKGLHVYAFHMQRCLNRELLCCTQVCALPPHDVSQLNKDALILATTDPVTNQPESKSAAVVPYLGKLAETLVCCGSEIMGCMTVLCMHWCLCLANALQLTSVLCMLC